MIAIDRQRLRVLMEAARTRVRAARGRMRLGDPNVKTICGSCAAGDHACGGDCSCPRCTGVINGLEPTP